METVLVTGGCGQSGLLEVKKLLEQGQKVIVYDNLSTGGFAARNLIPNLAEFILGDVRDELMLRRVLKDKHISQVIHCASVPKDHSFDHYEVNVGAWLKLQNICEDFEIALKQP